MKHVLVLQLCRFGDILQTTPMLRGLRRHHPGAQITLMVQDSFEHVPVPRTLYDRLVCLPYTTIATALAEDPTSWPEQVIRLQTLLDTLSTPPFDLTLNLSHSDLSSYLAAAIPSREVRGGLVATDRTRVVRGNVMTYFWASQLARAQGCFNLVDLHNWTAGVPCERSPVEVEISSDARTRMRGWLEHAGLSGRPLILVQLGASDDRKRWPPEQFAETLNQIDQAQANVALIGTEQERSLGERAMSCLTRPVAASFGETSIVELGALLESASLLLTNDTGAMHVATAVGTRVIDISTGPVFAHETGPYGEGHLVIEPDMSCFPCVAGADCQHLACRDTITPGDVAGLVRHALGLGPVPRPATARILRGQYRESGRLEYAPLWSPTASLQDVIRQLSAELWEGVLVPTRFADEDILKTEGRGRRTLAHAPLTQPPIPAEMAQTACHALQRVAARADRAAVLTGALASADPETASVHMAEVARELDALRVEAEQEPAARAIVAYLRVQLDSCVETDVGRLARVYVSECHQAGQRARRLATTLAATLPRSAPVSPVMAERSTSPVSPS